MEIFISNNSSGNGLSGNEDGNELHKPKVCLPLKYFTFKEHESNKVIILCKLCVSNGKLEHPLNTALNGYTNLKKHLGVSKSPYYCFTFLISTSLLEREICCIILRTFCSSSHP